jgi:hypothetical protein
MPDAPGWSSVPRSSGGERCDAVASAAVCATGKIGTAASGAVATTLFEAVFTPNGGMHHLASTSACPISDRHSTAVRRTAYDQN